MSEESRATNFRTCKADNGCIHNIFTGSGLSDSEDGDLSTVAERVISVSIAC